MTFSTDNSLKTGIVWSGVLVGSFQQHVIENWAENSLNKKGTYDLTYEFSGGALLGLANLDNLAIE